ncbi:hypothetical protein PHYSODRAFT_261225, partial [Phytophthora sojae]
MAARLLLARAAGRPRWAAPLVTRSSPSSSLAAFGRLAARAPPVAHPLARRGAFASSQFPGIQSSFFSSLTKPQAPEDKKPKAGEDVGAVKPKSDAFGIEKDT